MIRSGIRSGVVSGMRSTIGGASLVATLLAADKDTTNKDQYDFGTISLGAGELGLLFVVQTAGTANGVASFTGTLGASWTLVAERAVAGIRVQLYRTLSFTARSGTVLANFATGDVTTGCQWGGAKVPNAKQTGVNGADAIVQSNTASVASATTAAVALLSAPLLGSVVLYFLNHSANEGAAPTAAFTELADVSFATPNQGSMLAWGAAQSDAPTWTTSAASRWIAVEVAQP